MILEQDTLTRKGSREYKKPTLRREDGSRRGSVVTWKGGEMSRTEAMRGTRKPYVKPALITLSEKDLLEQLGPAQGYGSTRSMPLDSEWSRSS